MFLRPFEVSGLMYSKYVNTMTTGAKLIHMTPQCTRHPPCVTTAGAEKVTDPVPPIGKDFVIG